MSHTPPRVAVIACEVFRREIELHSAGMTNIAGVRYFEVGLHDRPDQLRGTLQAELDSMQGEENIDAIAFVYGLCGCGTVGLRSSRHKLVFPRAHDCITIFMGSKERYAEQQRACPTCYYYTPGWNRERRVPGPDRLEKMRVELSSQFDEDDVEFLVETEKEQWALHDTAFYIELGTDDASAEADYAERCADCLGWQFKRMRGDPKLLRDLLQGNWDEHRFQIVEPGNRMGLSPDEKIMRSETTAGEKTEP